MPTQAEFASLYSACGGSDSSYTGTITTAISLTGTVQPKGVYWCTDADGVVGALFSDGTSQIFFPAAGTAYNNSFADGSEGAYWASTLTGNTSIAYRRRAGEFLCPCTKNIDISRQIRISGGIFGGIKYFR